MSFPTRKPISSLPDEVLLLVAEQLCIADILNFLRVNSAYHRVGVDVLLKNRSTVNLVSAKDGVKPTLNPCLLNTGYAALIRQVLCGRRPPRSEET